MKIQSIGICIIVFLYFANNIYGQKITKQILTGKDSIPKYVKFDMDSTYHKSQDFELFRKHLKLSKSDSLVKQTETADKWGNQYVAYLQYYKGIKVDLRRYRTHIKDNKISSISGNFIKINNLSVHPSISVSEALRKALENIAAEKYMWEIENIDNWLKEEQQDKEASFYPKGELVVWSDSEGETYRLAYKFDIYAAEPMSHDIIYIDAQNGEFIDKDPILRQGKADGIFETRKSGTRTAITDSCSGYYRLYDPTRGKGLATKNMITVGGNNFSGAVEFKDNDNNWTASEWNNTAKDNAALDAHWAMQKTYDYFKLKHQRESYDNGSSAVNCYVHYKANWSNAKWDGNRILVGDGNTSALTDPWTSLDMIAHEFAHGICIATCNLEYKGESGAINEGLSDIWGACVEYYAAPEKNRWKIGEDIMTVSPLAIRYMYNPNLDFDPDTYTGTYWANPNCGNPVDSTDYCGVHTNSGVLNYWFYLLSEGGIKKNDFNNCFSVTGIGIDKAAQIVYKMETEYLEFNHQFVDARTYSIEAAEEIFGINSNEVIQTTNAWYAVGIGSPYPLNISESSPVCINDKTFNLKNLMIGKDVTWTVSSNLLLITSETDTSVVVKAINSTVKGNGWIKATATCGTTESFTKNVLVGKPDIITHTPLAQYASGYFNPVCNYETYTTNMDVTNGSNPIWSRLSASPSNTTWGQINDNLTFYFWAVGQTAVYRISSSNTCGTTSYDYGFKSIQCETDPCATQYTVAPNPATEESTIIINIPAPCDPMIQSQTFDGSISVYDHMGNLKKKEKYKTYHDYKLNLHGLKTGLYFIEIYDGKTIQKKTIFVE